MAQHEAASERPTGTRWFGRDGRPHRLGRSIRAHLARKPPLTRENENAGNRGMTDVPETPKQFFTQYIPDRFQLFKAGLAGKTSNGAMVFRVVGAGEWSLRLKNGELEVTDGMSDDVILQVTVSEPDFKPIFVR